jgi:hypothetical protein
LCCLIFPLEGEFWTGGSKPARKWCEHSCAKGCAVHDQPRPAVCENFTCDWLDHPELPDEFRPDRIGIILTTLGLFEGQGVIQVSEHYSGKIDKALSKLSVNAIFLVTYANEGFTRLRKLRGWADGEKERFLIWLTHNHKPLRNLNPNELKITEVR